MASWIVRSLVELMSRAATSPPATPTIALTAKVEQQGAPVARVEFLHERTRLGTADRQSLGTAAYL